VKPRFDAEIGEKKTIQELFSSQLPSISIVFPDAPWCGEAPASVIGGSV
jgi:hypothetical protein